MCLYLRLLLKITHIENIYIHIEKNLNVHIYRERESKLMHTSTHHIIVTNELEISNACDFMVNKQALINVFPFYSSKYMLIGASLVVQWLRVCLPMQGTRVRALVWEDPTCRGATGPVSHNY